MLICYYINSHPLQHNYLYIIKLKHKKIKTPDASVFFFKAPGNMFLNPCSYDIIIFYIVINMSENFKTEYKTKRSMFSGSMPPTPVESVQLQYCYFYIK